MAETVARVDRNVSTKGEGEVSSVHGRNEKKNNELRLHAKKEVEDLKMSILRGIQDREKDLEALREEHQNIGRSADAALTDIHNSFTNLMSFIEERMNKIEARIKEQRESEERRVRELQDKLRQEITELKATYSDLDNLPDNSSLNNIKLPASSSSPLFSCRLRYFADFPTAVSSLTSKLQQTLSEDCLQISQTVPDTLLSKPQSPPKTHTEFLQYSRELTLDSDSAHTMLLLSDADRKVTFRAEHQAYSQNSERFTHWPQVLSRESLTGRCYFEVEWAGEGVYVAVACKSIKREGNSYECVFGSNEKSWALCCTKRNNSFMHNGVKTQVQFHQTQRIGVYFDQEAGSLAFYSVFSDRVVLLHKVFIEFTEPLHAGMRLWATDSAAFFSPLL